MTWDHDDDDEEGGWYNDEPDMDQDDGLSVDPYDADSDFESGGTVGSPTFVHLDEFGVETPNDVAW